MQLDIIVYSVTHIKTLNIYLDIKLCNEVVLRWKPNDVSLFTEFGSVEYGWMKYK